MTTYGTKPRTLNEALSLAGVMFPSNGFTFQDLKGAETTYDFSALERATAQRASWLLMRGIKKGDRVGLVLVLPGEFVITFLAVMRMGAIAVPIYPPPYLHNIESYREQTARVLETAGARLLICSDSLANLLAPLGDRLACLEAVIPLAEVGAAPEPDQWPETSESDVVFLQYTSGSTADPKGVIVTHRSLIANIEGFMGAALKMIPGRDVGVTWLPLYHDMGLVGFVLGPLYWGVSVTFIPTLRFVVNPASWLEAIHRRRGTVSFGPNFAYALVLRKLKPHVLAQWDLSSMKAFGCGAEPVSPRTLRTFMETLGPRCALQPTVLMPAYGLAEATLAVSMAPLEQPMLTWNVDLDRFQSTGLAVKALDGRPAQEHVSCGFPLPGNEVVIVDKHNQFCPECVEGDIYVRGPSVTPGYFGDPELSAATVRGGWLRTGDLGYFRDGQLYVTGRRKDLIIVNGKKLHPQPLEWTAAAVDGVRQGSVVAFARPGPDGDEVVVALETSVDDQAALIALVDDAIRREHALDRLEIVCLAPGELPKTSSGKVKRHKARQLYLERASSQGQP